MRKTGLILGILALSALPQGNAQEEERKVEERSTEEKCAPYCFSVPVPIEIVEPKESYIARERRGNESFKNQKDDLIAQKRMADATEAMNEATQNMKNAAWWSVFLVGLGTFLLVWTLALTRSANISAQRAVAVTKRVGDAQARPYITFKKCEAKWDATYRCPKVRVTVENTGLSPTRKTEFKIVGAFEMEHAEKIRHSFPEERVYGAHEKAFPIGDVPAKGDFIFEARLLNAFGNIGKRTDGLTSEDTLKEPQALAFINVELEFSARDLSDNKLYGSAHFNRTFRNATHVTWDEIPRDLFGSGNFDHRGQETWDLHDGDWFELTPMMLKHPQYNEAENS